MYLKSFVNIYTSNGFDFNEAKSEIDFVLSVLFNYSYKDFILGKRLEDWQIKKAQEIFIKRTKTKKPIQQIVGKAFFYGRVFLVNEYTLIPRPETELVVSEVLSLLKSNKQHNIYSFEGGEQNNIYPFEGEGQPTLYPLPLQGGGQGGGKNPELIHKISNLTKNYIEILDIGTGTGCIGITLALENPLINATLVDIQKEALEIAKKNAGLYNCKNIEFIQSDLFENVNKKYDVIVSNPPYIPIKERDKLQIEVKDFEPSIALFTNDDEGLEFYEKIIKQAKSYLNKNGLIAFELGINQSDKVKKILEENNFTNINVIKDYNLIDRIITANNIIKVNHQADFVV